jgi:hypothetical protein
MIHRSMALLALTLVALIGCGKMPASEDQVLESMNQLRVAVKETVKDPERAQAVTTYMELMGDELVAAKRARETYQGQLKALDANYDATEADFHALMNEFNAGREKRLDRVLALRDNIIAKTTQEEWDALSKARLNTVKTVMK